LFDLVERDSEFRVLEYLVQNERDSSHLEKNTSKCSSGRMSSTYLHTHIWRR
jgi:hypothetical protein